MQSTRRSSVLQNTIIVQADVVHLNQTLLDSVLQHFRQTRCQLKLQNETKLCGWDTFVEVHLPQYFFITMHWRQTVVKAVIWYVDVIFS